METCESESAPPPSPSDQSRVLLEDPVKQNKAHPLHSNWAFYSEFRLHNFCEIGSNFCQSFG